MAIHTTNRSNKNTTQSTFSIALGDDNVQFNPSKSFAHVDTEQVLKIITKGNLEACDPNRQGYVNYQLTGKDKEKKIRILGFLNYYDNGLNKKSSEDEINESVLNLKDDLSSVKLKDITMPLSEDDADEMIDLL